MSLMSRPLATLLLVLWTLLISHSASCNPDSCQNSLLAFSDLSSAGRYQFIVSRELRKQLPKVPRNIRNNFVTWLELVQTQGLAEVRKRPGLHDEPVINALGHRSIRLNKGWRAFYRLDNQQDATIELMEINHHEY